MSILEEEISDATLRSRRRTQMPRYLKNSEVDYVPEQQLVHTPSGHSNEGEQLVGATGGPFAACNPLVASIDHFPAYKGSRHYYSPTSRQQQTYVPYRSSLPPSQENIYCGPTPTIPDFSREDPREFARLKVALDNLLPADATERFKFQTLTDNLKLEEALLIADSYSNSRYPYSHTMQALTELYGQPHQLALQRIAGLMDGPSIRSGDTKAFRLFALKIRVLVGMLDQLGGPGCTELTCGSHISRLLTKLPHDFRANFKSYVNPLKTPILTLLELAEWMEYEVRVQEDGTQFNTDSSGECRVSGLITCSCCLCVVMSCVGFVLTARHMCLSTLLSPRPPCFSAR